MCFCLRNKSNLSPKELFFDNFSVFFKVFFLNTSCVMHHVESHNNQRLAQNQFLSVNELNRCMLLCCCLNQQLVSFHGFAVLCLRSDAAL